MPTVTLVAVPTGADVLTYAGLPTDDPELAALADEHAEAMVDIVRAYVRGNGFTNAAEGPSCAPELARVIVSSAVRSLVNPTGERRTEVGSYNSLPADPGWSLRETLVLHGFRRRVG